MGAELNEKQERFCKEYVIDLNATQAAIRSGYSKKTAQEQSSRLLSNVIIKKRIDELSIKKTKKLELTAETILGELLALAKTDLSKAYDPVTGKLLPVHQMPEDCRRAISSIEVKEVYSQSIHIADTMKVKFYDKNKSLELLGRHLKLFTDKVEHSGTISYEDLISGSRIQE